MTVRGKPETNARHAAEYRERNREKLRKYARDRNKRIKVEALERYGLVCAECGFDDPRALCIDHIENNGSEERNSLGGQKFSGKTFYLWLKKNGWPDGYQTLCANCNLIKHVEFREEQISKSL